MGSYAQNMYNWLKKKGYSQKYDHPGIYCIKVNGKIAYIGKSHNMQRRVAEHYVGIKTQSEKKYRILAEMQRKGYSIDFDVLYNAKSTRHGEITQEIGEKEGEYIRKYHPPLNTQIPKEEDWQKQDMVEIDPQSVISLLLDEEFEITKKER